MRTFAVLATAAVLVARASAVEAQPLPVGTAPCPGVRPGALIETSKGLCSMNFVFHDGSGRRYVGTAGHCILGESPLGGEDVGEFSNEDIPGDREARDGEGNRIGDFVYAILTDDGEVTRDFSLVRLDTGAGSDPAMCHFGGPTGINADTTTSPVLLQQFGNGLLIGSVLPARTHVALSMTDPDEALALGVAVPGDSGSGVIDEAEGRAVGVLVAGGVAVGVGGPALVELGDVFITRIAPQLALAEAKLGLDLTLETAAHE
ncbi:MAG: hypothetical protein ACREQY_18145 [Candidatus Binatia bacterium]